jgi:hypothetical protein
MKGGEEISGFCCWFWLSRTAKIENMENKIDRAPALLITASGSFLTPFFKECSKGLHDFCLPLHGRDFRLPGKGKSEIKMAGRSSPVEPRRFPITDFGSVGK